MAHEKRAEDSGDSGVESDDSSVFAECLLEEEDHALGHDLMKKLQSQLQSTKGSGRGTFGAPGTLERKTVTWVRKTAGLIAKGDHGKKNSLGRVSTRRFTRKQALDNRQRKRERGLDILRAAVTELEGQYGPFLAPRTVKQQRTRCTDDPETVQDRSKNDRKELSDYNSNTSTKVSQLHHLTMDFTHATIFICFRLRRGTKVILEVQGLRYAKERNRKEMRPISGR